MIEQDPRQAHAQVQGQVWDSGDGPGIAEPPLRRADPEEKTRTRRSLDRPWKVVVLDDPVNLMPYVVLVFRRVFGYDREKAHQHMLEVHNKGRSVLWTGARERAEFYHAQLQKAHLSTVLEQED